MFAVKNVIKGGGFPGFLGGIVARPQHSHCCDWVRSPLRKPTTMKKMLSRSFVVGNKRIHEGLKQMNLLSGIVFILITIVNLPTFGPLSSWRTVS